MSKLKKKYISIKNNILQNKNNIITKEISVPLEDYGFMAKSTHCGT
jgi:hypothetical protein